MDGCIQAIGASLAAPTSAKRVVLNQLLLPGDVDCHTHLCATLQLKRDGEDFYLMALNHPHLPQKDTQVIQLPLRPSFQSGDAAIRQDFTARME